MTDPATIGDYRILAPLGRGGMGVVYRAVHLRTGEQVALKTVPVPREGMLQSIRREIQALARLRHPGIVRIVDHGVGDGLPWYAMELLDGDTLAALRPRPTASSSTVGDSWGSSETLTLEDAPELPRAPVAHVRIAAGGRLRDVLDLARALCSPLAWLHGEGIVHRDLKPENVFVVAGRPILVDFGLVARFGGAVARDAIELGGVQGTIEYMSPEQCRGEVVDARADLYALGCLLYDLLTGRPPFAVGAPSQILRQHLEAAPIPPSELVDGLPPGLDALVLGLLAKEPHERIGHADDVARALEHAGAAAVDDAPRPRTWLYRPRLAGRDEALAPLLDRLGRAAVGEGGLVVLRGESGVGKTRLAMEVARRARQQRIRVLAGECVDGAPRALQPLRPVLQAIADRCRERGPAETERLLGPRRAVLAPFEPSLASLGPIEPAPHLPADAAAHRLHLWLADTVLALAADAPLLLLIDDVQWVDDLTLGFLASQVRRFEAAPVLILATCRSDEIGAALLPVLAHAEIADVGRLDERGVSSIVADMLAATVPPAFGASIAALSEGNPFFVAEYLRAAVGEGLLGRNDGRWRLAGGDGAADLGLPPSLRDLVGRRLDGLSEAAREVVGAAAVIGREVDEALLAALLGDADAAVREAIGRQVLEDGAPLRFVHDKLREVAYATLPDDRRRQLHGAVANALEARGSDDHRAWMTLAAHRASAGDAERAGVAWLTAARRATARQVLADARTAYEAYLATEAAPHERVAARQELAEHVLRSLGQMEPARQQLQQIVDDARDAGASPHPAVLRALSACCRDLGRLDEADDAIAWALDLVRDGDGALRVSVLVERGHCALDRADMETAEAAYREALADPACSTHQRGHTLVALANLYIRTGHMEKAAEPLAAGTELLQAAGDHTAVAMADGKAALMYINSDQLDRAVAPAERALAAARQLGMRRMEGLALGVLASIRGHQGDHATSHAHLQAAIAIAREVGARRDEGMLLFNLPDACIAAGRPRDAVRACEEALVIHREVGNRRLEGATLAYLARYRRLFGELDAAQAALDAAVPLLVEARDRLHLIVALGEVVRLHLALGRPHHDALEQLRALAAGPGVEGLADAVAQIEDAVAAAAAGQPLHFGDRPDHVAGGPGLWQPVGR